MPSIIVAKLQHAAQLLGTALRRSDRLEDRCIAIVKLVCDVPKLQLHGLSVNDC